MPHRRPAKKGSFSGHFDELVKNFPPERSRPKAEGEDSAPNDDRSVHDRLFDSAWRKAREPHQPTR